MQTDALRDRVVLVVDDTSSFARDLQESLEHAGATVSCTALRDAPRAVGVWKVSIAIMDCHPPSRERRALIRRLRQDRVPFIFYSAQAPGDVTTERGAPFIEKPCPPEKMVAAVQYLLGRAWSPKSC